MRFVLVYVVALAASAVCSNGRELPKSTAKLSSGDHAWIPSYPAELPPAESQWSIEESPRVQVAQGTLKGREATSKNGNPYLSFQGIPYAKPPLGPLRFKAAEPAESWQGDRDALTTGPSCVQLYNTSFEAFGDEDCLYLNVYTPQLPSPGSSPRAVMVWIHGGSFIVGSGNPDFYGPDFLVDAGVVLVTLNYRLGVLGFLSLEDDEAPGNWGLKDQVAALRWVQQNIANFGGDPNNVTLFGESAGGASVHFQLLSPMSKGLFQKAIAQSGSTLSAWTTSKSPRDVAFNLGKILGYQGNSSHELVELLRSIDAGSLANASAYAMLAKDQSRLLASAFRPVVEVVVEGVERFLPGEPLQLIEQGQFHQVPFITGVLSAEGLLFYSYIAANAETFNDNMEQVVLPELRLPENYTKGDEVIKKIKKFYFNDQPVSENIQGFVNLYSDLTFIEGTTLELKLMERHATAPMYLYLFDLDTKLSAMKHLVYGNPNLPGAAHGDDFCYLFRNDMVDIDVEPGSIEDQSRSTMVEMWVNFAKTGNPTSQLNELVPITWPTYSTANLSYLHIADQLSVGSDLYKTRMDFWEELYRSA